jgi:Fic family protein
VPTYINQEWTWESPVINRLLERASLRLGELNSFSKLVPNIDLFLQLHITKEAVVSSKIEGTQTRMDEALLPVEEINPERRDDWREVNNYIKAITHATQELETLPISSRLIRSTHKLLLDSVRGQHKQPGEFRHSQNWIGGSSPSDAKYIPPLHSLVEDLMSDLEKFLNNDDINTPALIRIAIAHYQFETIHPFLDGNGRIGRLLITLFFVKEGILDRPILYLSSYFERNKSLYYDNLDNIRKKNDLLQWIKYFLVGVEQTAKEAVDTLQAVIHYKERTEDHIRSTFGRRSSKAILLLHELFQNPMITVEHAVGASGLSYKAANDLVKQMCEAGIIDEVTGQSRNRLYMFTPYLNLFKESDEHGTD